MEPDDRATPKASVPSVLSVTLDDSPADELRQMDIEDLDGNVHVRSLSFGIGR